MTPLEVGILGCVILFVLWRPASRWRLRLPSWGSWLCVIVNPHAAARMITLERTYVRLYSLTVIPQFVLMGRCPFSGHQPAALYAAYTGSAICPAVWPSPPSAPVPPLAQLRIPAGDRRYHGLRRTAGNETLQLQPQAQLRRRRRRRRTGKPNPPASSYRLCDPYRTIQRRALIAGILPAS